MLGSRTWGSWMEGTDKSTELWRQYLCFTVTLKKIYLKIGVMNVESSDPQLMAK